MPIPLVPVVAVAGAAAWLSMSDQGVAHGVAKAPDEATPPIDEKRPPPQPYVPSAPQGPRAGGDPPPADPVVQMSEAAVDAVTGEAVEVGKVAVAGAGAVLLSGGSIGAAASAAGASVSAAASSVGSSVSSAASGAAGVVGPAVVVAADVLMVAGAVFTMFGGDIESVLGLHGGPLSPEFDATTAAGQFHAREEANLIRQDLADTGTKYARMGAPITGVPGAGVDTLTLQQARTLGITSFVAKRNVLGLEAEAA